jgi:hypothetical protein
MNNVEVEDPKDNGVDRGADSGLHQGADRRRRQRERPHP